MDNDTSAEAGGAAPEPSGRFVLRISPGLHAALRVAAQEAGISLNDLCARRLATGRDGGAPVSETVLRATALYGEELVGVLGYGSWARGELSDDSDIDMLIVLSPSLRLTRELYRQWDREPIRWGHHPVEPHFVHPYEPGARVSALWAEVAMDGVVLFERSYRLSRTLVAIRGRIRTGDLERRRAHGHPYWVEAA